MMRKAKLFNFGTLKRMVLALNVGQRNGVTFIGGPRMGGNHWVLVDVELRPFMNFIIIINFTENTIIISNDNHFTLKSLTLLQKFPRTLRYNIYTFNYCLLER